MDMKMSPNRAVGRVIAERLAIEQREFMTEMDLLHMQTKVMHLYSTCRFHFLTSTSQVHETAFHEYLPPLLIQTPR